MRIGPWTIALSVLLVGCRSERSETAIWPRLGGFKMAIAPRFPELTEARAKSYDPLFIDRMGAIEVASNGVTALFSETFGETSVILIGVDGAIIRQITRPGEGPGEFRWPSALGFADSVLHVFSLSRSVSIRFGSRGDYLGEDRLPVTSRGVIGIAGGVADIAVAGNFGFDGIDLAPLGLGTQRPFLRASDAFVAKAAADPYSKTSRLTPPYVRYGRFGIVGIGKSYQLAVFDTSGAKLGEFGRQLPSRGPGPRGLAQRRADLERALSLPSASSDVFRKRLDTLDRITVPHFGRGDLGVDARGRLWVVGSVGDSTFADVFADTLFLGRHLLPCLHSAGGVSVNGTYFALRCLSDDDEGFRLRLFKIVDRP